jgi:hypothetical protein
MMANTPGQGQIGPETYSSLAKQLFGKEPAMPEVAPAAAPAPAPQQGDLTGALNLNMGAIPNTSAGVLQEQMRIAPQLGRAGAELESAKMGVESDVMAGKAQEQQRYSQNVQAGIDKFQEDKRNWPVPEFHPTQENAQSIGELFSLVATFGVMLGAGAKSKSQAAMGAMTGMLDGWKKGRKDLYERELKEFDKHFQSMKLVHEEMRKDFEDYLKLAVNDRDAASLKLEAMIRKAGSSSIAAKLLSTGQLQAYDNLLQNGYKLLADKEAKVESIRQHNEKIKMDNLRLGLDREKFAYQKTHDAALLIEKQREFDERQKYKVDDVAADLNSRGVNIADKKERAKVQEGVASMANLKDLQREIIEKPYLSGRTGQIAQFTDRYIKSFRDGIAFDESKVAPADQEALLFAKKYASMLTRYERALADSGRTTVAFQKRYDTLLSQNQFNPQSMIQLFDDMQKEAASVAMTKSPKLTYEIMDDMADQFNGRLSGGAQARSTSEYQIGQTIEIKGKKYKVTGLSDPNNPDIEEVK